MKVIEKYKYEGSCQMIAVMLVFLLAAFLPGISYADNVSPEMNQFARVVSVPQNQDGTGTDINPGTPDAAAHQNENSSDKDNLQEDRMKLLKPVDALLPPMDPEYGKMLFWADKMEQFAAEVGDTQGEEKELESKPASLELLAELDDARKAMEAGLEPGMSSDAMPDDDEKTPRIDDADYRVLDSEDMIEFNPTEVSLTIGGGDFTVDYTASEQEYWMVKALQDVAAESETLAIPASVLEASGLRLEDQENTNREISELNASDDQVFSVFALPAPIDLGSQIAKQVGKMFFPPEETVEMPSNILSKPSMPEMGEPARMREVLNTMTLSPPVQAENAPDAALLAEEMGLLAPIAGMQKPEGDAGSQNSELKQVMESGLSLSDSERIAEAIDLIVPPEMFKPKIGGEKLVGDLIPSDLEEASKKMDESQAENVAFPAAALKMARNLPQQRSLTSAPDTVGVFHKIVNQAMKPLVATFAPMVPSLVSEASRVSAPRHYSFFSDDTPSRPTNFLEERFSFVSYVFPSVSYYRVSRGSSYSYSSNYDGSKKKRRRYYV